MVLALVTPAWAEEELYWDSPIEIDKIHQMVKALETDPLGKDAKALLVGLYAFMDKMDPEFVVCLSQFAPLLDSKKGAHEDLWMHVAIASGDYLLDHPEDIENEPAYQEAGLEGMLRAYENMVRAKPKLRHEFLEHLVELRDQGNLRQHVMDNMCE